MSEAIALHLEFPGPDALWYLVQQLVRQQLNMLSREINDPEMDEEGFCARAQTYLREELGLVTEIVPNGKNAVQVTVLGTVKDTEQQELEIELYSLLRDMPLQPNPSIIA